MNGGPSLKFWWDMLARSGIQLDALHAWEMGTTEEAFYDTVPEELKSMMFYKQTSVSSHLEEDSDAHPFIPQFIKKVAHPNDYTVFKLDIDSPHVENGNIDFILADDDNHIDEVAWEHHISGNYLMEEWGDLSALAPYTLRESYDLFLRMRMKGIRAHSWI